MKKAKTRALSLAGKIMAAQIAGQPSKYRVETEKSLDKVLAAATSSNTILISGFRISSLAFSHPARAAAPHVDQTPADVGYESALDDELRRFEDES